MKHITDKLHQLAFNRLNTRLKHLRGKHDQLDHAWNRGMGQGGGGVGLAPNQMGPLPTADFYRKRRIELMNQQRQGLITRAEMRQEMRQLRGITLDSLSDDKKNTLVSSESIQETLSNIPDIAKNDLNAQVDKIRAEIIDSQTQIDIIDEKINVLASETSEIRNEFVRTLTNNTWIQLISALGNDYINQLDSEIESITNSVINNDKVKDQLRMLKDKINNIEFFFTASNDEKELFIDNFNSLATLFQFYNPNNTLPNQKRLVEFSKLYSSIFTNVYGRYSNYFPSDYRNSGPHLGKKLGQGAYVLSTLAMQNGDESLMSKSDELNDLMNNFYDTQKSFQDPNKQKIDELKNEKTDLQEEIKNKRQELKKLEKQIRFDSGMLVDSMYQSDPMTQPYYAPDVIPEETKKLMDIHGPLSDAIERYGDEAYEAIRSMGLDPDDPEHIQMLGDLLGAFFDDENNSSFDIEIDTMTDAFLNETVSFRLTSFVKQSDKKTIEVDRTIIVKPSGISISNSSLRQNQMKGIGHAALTRQIPAAIKISNILKKPVSITADAYSKEPDFNGYHLWPKMSFNFSVNKHVADILTLLGFPDYNLSDTFSVMMSSDKAKITPEMIEFANTYNLPLSLIRSFEGKNAMSIWSDVVDLAMKVGGSIQENGSGYIDASSDDVPPIVENIMLEYYNEYKRQQLRAATKSIKNKKYATYLESQGFSMEDMEAFEYAWDMARKRGLIK